MNEVEIAAICLAVGLTVGCDALCYNRPTMGLKHTSTPIRRNTSAMYRAAVVNPAS